MNLQGTEPSHREATTRGEASGGWIEPIGRFVAYDGSIPGGIAVALMLGTYALLNVPVSGPLLAAAFCGTLVVYQLDRVLGVSPEDRVNRPGRTVWMQKHQRYVWAMILGGAFGCGAMMPLLRSETIVLAAGLGLIGGLHVVPVLPGARRLKTFGRVKPVLIAGVWAVGAVALPLVEAGYPLTLGAAALLVYRLGFVGANLLLADAADRAGDRRAGLTTLATRWPPPQIERFVGGLLAVLLAGGGLALGAFGAPPLLAVDLLGPLLMAAVLLRGHGPPWERAAALDLVVAWPVVPFLLHLIAGVA